MLEITLKNQRLDLPDDIDVELQLENPMFSSDRVPVGFSSSFDIPDSAHNLEVLGHPERIAGRVDFSAKHPGKIRFGGATIADGAFIIEEVGDGVITLHFEAAILPETVDKKLFKIDLGTQNLGTATKTVDNGVTVFDTTAMAATWNATLTEQTAKEAPDFVAPTMKIDGEEFTPTEELEKDVYTNLAAMFVNPFNNNTYSYTYGSSREFGKIIPSFRVGWLLRKILPLIPENIFDTVFKRLMIVCNYHPSYNDAPSSPTWTLDDKTSKVTVRFADFMPDVEAREIIIEALKMVCGSLYVNGSQMTLELNRDLLTAPCELDWSDRLLDDYTLSSEVGQDYSYGYGSDGSDEAAPDVFVEVESMASVLSYIKLSAASPYDDAATRQKYYIRSTGQYIEAIPNPNLTPDNGNPASVHYDFKIIATKSGGATSDDDDKRDSYDSTLSARVVQCNLVNQVRANPQYVAQIDEAWGVSSVPRLYCPVIEKSERRPTDITFGLWMGRVNCSTPGYGVEYPCVTMSNVDPAGVRKSPVSLQWTGDDGLIATFHSEFMEWLAKDKKLLKCDLLLSVNDLHRLDLRRKVHIRGVDFFIKTISISLGVKKIAPAEAELIEL